MRSLSVNKKVNQMTYFRRFVKKFDKVLPQRGVSIKKHSKPGTNKVNLNIVLSQDFPLNTENDYLSSDAEDNDEAGAIQVENGKTNVGG